MKSRYLISACCLAMLPYAALAEKDPDSRKFSADRVFDLEFADDPQISPNGSTIVYSRKSMDKFTDQVKADLWSINTKRGRRQTVLRRGLV